MPIILAIEPDRRQAAHVSAIVRHRVGAELILADTTEAALDAIGSRVPDLVLVPALLSPQDDAALNAALRVIAAAAHVRALTIPVFANGVEAESRGGLLSRWMRGRSDASSDGCDPAVFAEPETLDVARTDNPHISFGAGIHFCIGAPLARVELQAAFGALLERTSFLELGGEPVRRPEFVIRGLARLPVVLGR